MFRLEVFRCFHDFDANIFCDDHRNEESQHDGKLPCQNQPLFQDDCSQFLFVLIAIEVFSLLNAYIARNPLLFICE